MFTNNNKQEESNTASSGLKSGIEATSECMSVRARVGCASLNCQDFLGKQPQRKWAKAKTQKYFRKLLNINELAHGTITIFLIF